ncbi:TPA: hypothetical protein ACGOY2_001761 [Streptococcus suis]
MGLFVPKVIGQFLDRHFLVDLLDHPIKLIGYLSLFILINVIKVFGNYLICRVGNLAIKEVQVIIYSDLLHSEVSALDHFQSGDIAVWSLEDALIAAYEQGRKDGQNESKD